MWEEFGNDTITCMARGTRYLAKIWQSAWDAGDGDANIGVGAPIKDLAKKKRAIMALYNDPDVAPSVGLDHYPDNIKSDWSGIKRPPAPVSSKTK